MVTHSPCRPIDAQEYQWLTRGRTFCLRTQHGKQYVSTGGQYWEAQVHPLRPLAEVGDIGRADAPGDLPFVPFNPKTAVYSCEPEQVYACGPWDWVMLFGLAVLDLALQGTNCNSASLVGCQRLARCCWGW